MAVWFGICKKGLVGDIGGTLCKNGTLWCGTLGVCTGRFGFGGVKVGAKEGNVGIGCIGKLSMRGVLEGTKGGKFCTGICCVGEGKGKVLIEGGRLDGRKSSLLTGGITVGN